ncbi:serine hydrolase domain-containing protein [Nocardia ninae]|uniref:Serine hydrolase n=1 Tax=Nocardia ninae NBRC 108245 TaxID=1210091 RepID=A0A511M921_9NOCA|nr:serine hydrolase domain-containing protein [Nocardia ninae]GEM37165.1 serine hydrolase [Nocardia ninae NBRC 108245]
MLLRRFGIALVSAIVLVGSAATGAVATPAVTDRAPLQQAMDELIAAGAAGIQVRVHDRHGGWTGAAGVAQVDRPEPVPVDGRFRIGSITKMFVATVLLQLAGEGRLGLDDPVQRHLPQFGLDPRITVRMLLQHTSGLFNYTGELQPDGTFEEGILPMSGKAAVDAVRRDYRPDELIRMALTKPARFEPGADWSYSNTNYQLAGLLIEKLTGLPYSVQIYGRIVAPLGLWETLVPGSWPEIIGPHAHGYLSYGEGDAEITADMTSQNPTWVGAAGEMISSTRDLDTFLTALLGGRLLAPPLLAEMRATYAIAPGLAYGLGLMEQKLGPDCVGLGHNGGVPGYYSDAYSTADGNSRIEVSITTGPGLRMDDLEQVAELSTKAQSVLAEGLCGR